MNSHVHWTCPKCNHRHEWEWPTDILPGQTQMHCDGCLDLSRMLVYFDPNGRGGKGCWIARKAGRKA